MLNNLKRDLGLIENIEEFKTYKEKNPEAYFYAAFLMLDSTNIDPKNIRWQLNFYSPLTDTVSSFLLGEPIMANYNLEILKNEDDKLKKTDISEVVVDIKDSLLQINKLRETKFSGMISNIIFVLQNTKEHGIVWNVTFLKNNFSMFNVKVNAKTGDIVKEEILSLKA